MPTKISGEGYASLQLAATDRHELAFDEQVIALPVGGLYRQRFGEEVHAYSAQLMHLLQTSVSTDSYSTYLQFSRGVRDLPPVYLRAVLEFNYAAVPISIDEVRSEEHTSELQSLMRISYAVFCLKKKTPTHL